MSNRGGPNRSRYNGPTEWVSCKGVPFTLLPIKPSVRETEYMNGALMVAVQRQEQLYKCIFHERPGMQLGKPITGNGYWTLEMILNAGAIRKEEYEAKQEELKKNYEAHHRNPQEAVQAGNRGKAQPAGDLVYQRAKSASGKGLQTYGKRKRYVLVRRGESGTPAVDQGTGRKRLTLTKKFNRKVKKVKRG